MGKKLFPVKDAWQTRKIQNEDMDRLNLCHWQEFGSLHRKRHNMVGVANKTFKSKIKKKIKN